MGDILSNLIDPRWLIAKAYELYRRQQDPGLKVAARFVKLFEWHGVSRTQIQHFIPEVTLDRIGPLEDLRQVLSNEVLNRAANLFNVQRAWLDGSTDQIYPSVTCYNDPEEFISILRPILSRSHSIEVMAYCNVKRIDKTVYDPKIVLVIAEYLDTPALGKDIVRFTPFTEVWDWSYSKCRVQLKAMARVLYKEFHEPTFLYFAKDSTLSNISEGKRIPYDGYRIVDCRLEDFALSEIESKVSKQSHELPHVLSYIEACKMISLAQAAKPLSISE